MPNTTNNVMERAELAMRTVLLTSTTNTVVSGAILLSDEDETKPPMPYVVARAKSFEEEITPGSGIFKVNIGLEFKSHVKDTTEEERQAVIIALNNFAYSAPASALSSAVSGFYVHGWVPTRGEMTVDSDQKAYIYELEYDCYCMPTANS